MRPTGTHKNTLDSHDSTQRVGVIPVAQYSKRDGIQSWLLDGTCARHRVRVRERGLSNQNGLAAQRDDASVNRVNNAVTTTTTVPACGVSLHAILFPWRLGVDGVDAGAGTRCWGAGGLHHIAG